MQVQIHCNTEEVQILFVSSYELSVLANYCQAPGPGLDQPGHLVGKT